MQDKCEIAVTNAGNSAADKAFQRGPLVCYNKIAVKLNGIISCMGATAHIVLKVIVGADHVLCDGKAASPDNCVRHDHAVLGHDALFCRAPRGITLGCSLF